MKKYIRRHLLATLIFIFYCATLIKVMVFKDLPTFRVGQLMLNFGGTESGRPANFVPFKTIFPYLFGDKGLIIAGINLVGNIVLLVPLGFLLPLVYRNMTWKKSLIFAVASGGVIEGMQVILRVGIFDIDDVILNALGVMIGYWMFIILAKWLRSKNYKNIIITTIIVIAAAATAFYVVYPWGQPVMNPRGVQSDRLGKEGTILPAGRQVPQSGDLCGGTGGNGQIISVGNNTFSMKRKDGRKQIINLTDKPTIKTSKGSISTSELKIGDRVTLIGGPNPDGSFTADTVVVCSVTERD